jgi:enamine deaminase RidA (YjgF/YER057c/UK114 family)
VVNPATRSETTVTLPVSAERRLVELGLTLPEPPRPVAVFEPFTRVGDLVFTAGQIATDDGGLVATGRLGAEVDPATGRLAARACALNVLAQLRAAAGSLDAVAQLVKATVFVASTPEFTGQPEVADGASELFVEVLGEAGRHARSAVGVAALPLGSPVEVEVIARLASGAGR